MNNQPTLEQTRTQTIDEQSVFSEERAASRTPRPVFFGDPVTDTQWDLIMALTNELGATRARLDALERVLVEQQTMAEGAVDRWVPDEDAAIARTHDHQSFIRRVYNTLTLGR